MELVRLQMVRHGWQNLPDHHLPAGFRVHWFRPGDEDLWCELQALSDRYSEISRAVFEKAFASRRAELGKRQLFLVSETGIPVGTATAWTDDDFGGEQWGQVHWVAVLPEWQGRGLSKPLLSQVCRRLQDLGENRAYLNTADVRIPAINLYLYFGFRPKVRTEEEKMAWSRIEPDLRYSLS
jgi:GNAT superfamily N-acetyltransferase